MSLLALVALTGGASPAPSLDRLPDLDQKQPTALELVTPARGPRKRLHLAFVSSVENVGDGPAVVEASRPTTEHAAMPASQVIHRSDGSTRSIGGIGALHYNHSSDHSHWHYLGFERYELRRASDYSLVAPDQKTGFCLVDSYRMPTGSIPPGAPTEPVFEDRCALGDPGAIHVLQGISVGFGDPYAARLDGQYIDITGVPSGQYFLVHRVNADRALLERGYSNNAASVLFALRAPRRGRPTLAYLQGCPDSDFCPGRAQRPPRVDRRLALQGTRAAVRHSLGGDLHSLTVTCPARKRTTTWACGAHATRGPSEWTAAVSLAVLRTRHGVLYWTYVVEAKEVSRPCTDLTTGGCETNSPTKRGRIPLKHKTYHLRRPR